MPAVGAAIGVTASPDERDANVPMYQPVLPVERGASHTDCLIDTRRSYGRYPGFAFSQSLQTAQARRLTLLHIPLTGQNLEPSGVRTPLLMSLSSPNS